MKGEINFISKWELQIKNNNEQIFCSHQINNNLKARLFPAAMVVVRKFSRES